MKTITEVKTTKTTTDIKSPQHNLSRILMVRASHNSFFACVITERTGGACSEHLHTERAKYSAVD